MPRGRRKSTATVLSAEDRQELIRDVLEAVMAANRAGIPVPAAAALPNAYATVASSDVVPHFAAVP